ncbi:MAG: hypothetical protein A2X87_07095 [Deltaproteobacteria bacterium GWC2_42_51]|nr:MAG: hypothetical protein A2056_05765 [Deltaproteobacteria bacterium GWA2_42_85]OGP23934.1 MAG: hypothetical protein A2067_01570 [Deltaproteobacteria bacterium GWB2_42_7]OGP33800.1 MAG: hypothetical protein A2X87_07095 [Deltaproteobacteria bacterium GWC2_42_51]OGP40857.1 MAG: hypothetical protein A2090_05560 [Deltaproteobacteria bacterium GWD2_42_10]OGP48640.1 MAG: hypothetical protein A2022_11050 [Deltaproteobacteria bacterium GWF2_42_12]OGQ36907.1 MAG: hypothetical protein A3H47_03490 [De
MKTIVPDASVLLKWVLKDDEAHRGKALSILSLWLEGKCDIILPSLWLFEVGSIISRREPSLAKDIMKKFLGYEFTEIKITEPLLSLIMELVNDKRVTFYDAAYHAAAIYKHGIFITADNKYYKKAKDRGCIQLLSNFTQI